MSVKGKRVSASIFDWFLTVRSDHFHNPPAGQNSNIVGTKPWISNDEIVASFQINNFSLIIEYAQSFNQ